MKERHQAGLAELADMGLALARDLHARALAAKDDRVACELTLAFHRISRSLRQTYALQARLEREHRLALGQARQAAVIDAFARAQKKRAQVRKALAALIWTEREPDEAKELLSCLDDLVADHSEDEDAFLQTPVETCILRLREDLGLTAVNDDDAPHHASHAAPHVLIWKSSG